MNVKIGTDNQVSTFEQYKLERRYRLIVGIYLSALAFLILLPIVTIEMSVTVQQALAFISGLLFLSALDAFKKCLEDGTTTPKSSILGDTYNVYNQNTYNSGTYNTYHKKQDLAEAAVEIQQLLNHLSETYPTTTEQDRLVLATEAVEAIENNPTLKQRIRNAMRAAGKAALEQLVDHPSISLVVAAMEESGIDGRSHSSDKSDASAL